jgi:hypothetical protein
MMRDRNTVQKKAGGATLDEDQIISVFSGEY